MPYGRRRFIRSLGRGLAGGAVLPLIGARGLEASAEGWPTRPLSPAGDATILLDSNENPNGPGREVRAALEDAIERAGRYPFTVADELRASVAKEHGVEPTNVLLGCGSTELLRVAVDAFVRHGAPLVTGLPSYENPVAYAEGRGLPVVAVPVDRALGLDLDAMRDKSVGAGLVYLCNPNNPTGTVHSGNAVDSFIDQVLRRSPRAAILIDEAYFEYVERPDFRTAIPRALADPRIVVLRTFSKVHGMAGLRIGYAVAATETIDAMAPYRLRLNVNGLAAVAARASLGARKHIERQVKLNREARAFTTEFFSRNGHRAADSATNFVMVEIGRPVEEFRKACADRGVAIGRPFPPLTSHARISIGTMDEMRRATRVFADLLGSRAGDGR